MKFQIKKLMFTSVLLLFVIFTSFFQYKSNKKDDLFINEIKKSRLNKQIEPDINCYLLEEVKTGKKIRISELGTKPIFISFWFTECKGCIYEFPSIEKLHLKFPDLQMLIITHDSTNKVQHFLRKHPFDLPFYTICESETYTKRVKIWPTTLLYNKNKMIFQIQNTGNYDSKNVFQLIEEQFSEK